MEKNTEINGDKVRQEFNDRAVRHGNINAVLDAGAGETVEHQNVFRDFITRKALKSALRPLQKDRILDFGCGIGRLTAFIARFCRQVDGVDISPEMINLAKQKNPGSGVSFQVLEGTRLPFTGGTFSKIFTVWVVQHLDDAGFSGILREFHRVLGPGGILVMLEQVRDQRRVFGEIHIQRTREEYFHLLEKEGFKVVTAYDVFRKPSYALSLWNRFPFIPAVFLTVLGWIEKWTIHRKPEYAEYYTAAITAVRTDTGINRLPPSPPLL